MLHPSETRSPWLTSSSALDEMDVTFPTGDAFLKCCSIGADECRLFCPNQIGETPGAKVRVNLGFRDQVQRFTLEGRVLRALEDPRSPRRSGLVVSVRNGQLEPFASACALARGLPMEMGRRLEQRWSVRLAVSFESANGCRGAGEIVDISKGGVRVDTPELRPAPDERVQLMISNGGPQREKLSARVAWVGFRAFHPGFGARFVGLSESAGRWLESTLARAKAQ
jgi:hypothetical protein